MKKGLRYFLINQNPYVYKEYQDYLAINKESHWYNKRKTLFNIIKLNLKHRIFKRVKVKIVNQKSINETEDEFIRSVIGYDIISFDVFDTLIFRSVQKPDDIFYIMEEKYKFYNFRNLRIKAEIEARRRSLENNEITLLQIYQVLSEWSSIDIIKWMDYEVQLEKHFCLANKYFMEIYKKLVIQGKKILAISDMYLPSQVVKSLLEDNGYNNIEIIVSSDVKKSKANGELYKMIKDENINHTWIHIGDNYISDIKMASRNKISTKYYANINDLSPYYVPDLSTLTSALYHGIINSYFRNNIKSKASFFGYGFENGGILTCGYCEWINQISVEKTIDKILFVARDGYIINKAYNMYYKQIPNEYIAFSRFVSQQILFEINIEEYIDQVLRPRIYSDNKITVEELLKEIDLLILAESLNIYGLNGSDRLVPELYIQIKKLIYNERKQIIDYFEKTQKAAFIYLKNLIADNKNILVVDVGWYGTGAIAIKYLLEQKYEMNINVHGCLIGARDNPSTNIMITNKTLSSFSFSNSYNVDLLKWHNGQYSAINDMLVEIMFSAPQPSFLKFQVNNDDKVVLKYGEAENNYDMIVQIHNGILEFVKNYVANSSECTNSITGRDAYLPIMRTIKDHNYCYKLFEDYEINQLSGVFSKARKTKLGDIMIQNGYSKRKSNGRKYENKQ